MKRNRDNQFLTIRLSEEFSHCHAYFCLLHFHPLQVKNECQFSCKFCPGENQEKTNSLLRCLLADKNGFVKWYLCFKNSYTVENVRGEKLTWSSMGFKIKLTASPLTVNKVMSLRVGGSNSCQFWNKRN